MSFPNPDNYARSCDCGTAGSNSTPPPATIQSELDSLTSSVTDLQTTLTSTGPDRGVIDTSGNAGVAFGGYGGDIFTIGSYGNTGGSIDLSAGSSGNGGSILLNSAQAGGQAPSIICGTGLPTTSLFPNGSLYLRIDGTASTTLYVRAAGAWSALS